MSDTKPCPYCAETIKSAAIICRFCNRNLSEFDSPVRVLSPSEMDRPDAMPNRMSMSKQIAVGTLIAFAFALLLFIVMLLTNVHPRIRLTVAMGSRRRPIN